MELQRPKSPNNPTRRDFFRTGIGIAAGAAAWMWFSLITAEEVG